MTKKLLVAYDPEKPFRTTNDHLVPVRENDSFFLLGLETGEMADYGMVVYTGFELTPNDLLAKLLENTNRKVSDVDQMMRDFSAYLEMVKKQNLADIVKLTKVSDSVGFRLVRTGRFHFPKTRLP